MTDSNNAFFESWKNLMNSSPMSKNFGIDTESINKTVQHSADVVNAINARSMELMQSFWKRNMEFIRKNTQEFMGAMQELTSSSSLEQVIDKQKKFANNVFVNSMDSSKETCKEVMESGLNLADDLMVDISR